MPIYTHDKYGNKEIDYDATADEELKPPQLPLTEGIRQGFEGKSAPTVNPVNPPPTPPPSGGSGGGIMDKLMPFYKAITGQGMPQ